MIIEVLLACGLFSLFLVVESAEAVILLRCLHSAVLCGLLPLLDSLILDYLKHNGGESNKTLYGKERLFG